MSPSDKQEVRRQVLNRLECRASATDEAVYREIDQVILKMGVTRYGTLMEKQGLRKQIFNSLRRLDILEDYLQDDSVTEIMVVGAEKVFIEQNGRLRRTEAFFDNEDEVYRLVDQILAPSNRMVNESSPIVDSRLPDGSRVHIVLPPISLVGPVITIRKFQKGGMTIKKLVEYGAFPRELAKVLSCFVKGRYNLIVEGATGCGKSSLLNALAEYIGKEERIITIEDSAELQFYHVDNLVRLETRNANVEGMNQVTMGDLIKASLRMRPERIIVGEVRGGEAVSMLQAVSTGHNGSFSSIHANSCRDALRRLETMALMGMDMPLRAVQGLIASSIDILIHLGRLPSGQRKLLEISEVLEFGGEEYVLNPLFAYYFEKGEQGSLHAQNDLVHTERMKGYGVYDAFCEAMEEFRSAEVRR